MRWAVTIVAALLTGALVTVAVAWSCAVWGSSRAEGLPSTGLHGCGAELHLIVDLPERITWRFAAGWPCRCLQGTRTTVVRPPGGPTISDGLLPVPRSVAEPTIESPIDFLLGAKYLPTHVLPGRFIVDVLCYSAALLTFAASVLRARSVLRGFRGRCRACGYDRRGLAADAVCPECGRAGAA